MFPSASHVIEQSQLNLQSLE